MKSYPVKLSGKKCVSCEKTETMVIENKEEDFKAPVCGTHLYVLLKKWEKPEPVTQ
jgi:predicted RNA-binding Zn-ribbon protein involved in translation (DUF1610 family)